MMPGAMVMFSEPLLSATNVPVMYCPGALLPMNTEPEVVGAASEGRTP